MMNQRNLAKASILTAIILGMGTVYAGGHKPGENGEGYHHRHGHPDRMLGVRGTRHLVAKASEDLMVTETQLDALRDILKARRNLQGEHQSVRHELMLEALALDPAAEDFDEQAAELADRVAIVARDRALELTGILKQVATVLTPEQLREMRQIMAAGIAPHNHNGPKDGA